MGKPTILYLVTEDWYFCSHRLPVARAARDAGYRVVVACRVTNHGEAIHAEGFELQPVKLHRSGLNPFAELASFREILALYKTVCPDIVHQVALKPILYGSWAAFLAKVPAVINAFAGLGHLFTSQSRKATVARTIVRLGAGPAIRRTEVTSLFQNDDDRKTALAAGIAVAERSVLIRGSGIDTEGYRPVGNKPEPPVALLASRMLTTKGIFEFAEAARLLNDRGVAVRMVLGGEPDQLNPASIPAETLASFPHVEWRGRIDDMPKALNEAAIGVLPSYREGLPKSLLEAAAAGLPLVAFDVPGCREIVQEGVNGFLTPPQDAIALADAIERLATDRGLRERMGAASRKRAVEEFAETVVAEQTMELYETVRGEER